MIEWAIRWQFAEPSGSKSIGSYHGTVFWIITALAFVTRFYGIDHPSEVVFDESHILKFVSWYLSRSYFFDSHPPLGRLLYTLVAWLAGWDVDGKIIDWDSYHVGESYIASDIPYLALRSTAAMMSTFTVCVVYMIMWETGHGIPACIVAAGLVLFDNAQIAQTRLIYLDSILCFSIVCSLLCYIKFSKLRDRPMSTQWWIWLLSTGLALSCSISTKYVGLFTYLTIGKYVIIDLWDLLNVKSGRGVSLPEFAKHFWARCLALVLIPFTLYLSIFRIHFAILTNSGIGDEFMSDDFIGTLDHRDAVGDVPVTTISFFRKWTELQWTMLEETTFIPRGHPYESRPYQWPFSSGSVAFWCSAETEQQIYFLGNLPGWWIATASVAAFPIIILADQLCRARGREILSSIKISRLYESGGLFFLVWTLHYFPFFLMNRQLMLHTYLPAHLASTMVAGSLIDLLDSKAGEDGPNAKAAAREQSLENETARKPKLISNSDPDTVHSLLYGSTIAAWVTSGVVLLAVVSFWWFWLPLTYGFDISRDAIRRRAVFGRLQYVHR